MQRWEVGNLENSTLCYNPLIPFSLQSLCFLSISIFDAIFFWRLFHVGVLLHGLGLQPWGCCALSILLSPMCKLRSTAGSYSYACSRPWGPSCCLIYLWFLTTLTGDSGGPLLIADYGKNGELRNGRPDMDIITGITSFGDSCNDVAQGAATAYIALPPFLAWIKGTISGIDVEPTKKVL